MKVGVWDTYVTNKNGSIMHFDIIVPEEVNELTTIFNYGREYLKLKGQEGQPIIAAATAETAFWTITFLARL
jgi:hypothetical protein